MKNIFCLLTAMLVLASCSKKTVPEKTEVAKRNAMIVIDGNGRIITPKEKLPAEDGIRANYAQLERSFTPDQKANLMARHKTIPPRVLYVPKEYTLTSARGTYCVYKKKFWYWKKSDGLFYLDEVYYK